VKFNPKQRHIQLIILAHSGDFYSTKLPSVCVTEKERDRKKSLFANDDIIRRNNCRQKERGRRKEHDGWLVVESQSHLVLIWLKMWHFRHRYMYTSSKSDVRD
jgi:hypothetical protein